MSEPTALKLAEQIERAAKLLRSQHAEIERLLRSIEFYEAESLKPASDEWQRLFREHQAQEGILKRLTLQSPCATTPKNCVAHGYALPCPHGEYHKLKGKVECQMPDASPTVGRGE